MILASAKMHLAKKMDFRCNMGFIRRARHIFQHVGLGIVPENIEEDIFYKYCTFYKYRKS